MAVKYKSEAEFKAKNTRKGRLRKPLIPFAVEVMADSANSAGPSGEAAENLDLERAGPAELLFNRELNWLEFNRKVLAEAADEANPLLERLKFLAIFFNNLDEFFMVRVAGLTRQRKLGAGLISQDGLGASEQLAKIRRRIREHLKDAADLWRKKIKPELFAQGLKLITYQNLSAREKKELTEFFQKEVYPILTPQALDKGRPLPQVSSGSLNILIELQADGGKIHLARLKLPDNLPRFISLPLEGGGLISQTLRPRFSRAGVKLLPLEILIGRHLPDLFPGYAVKSSLLFRITRNTDLEIEEDEADDLLHAVREYVQHCRSGEVVRLQTAAEPSKRLTETLKGLFEIEDYQHYASKMLLGASNLMSIANLDLPRLRFKPLTPRRPLALKKSKSFFKLLKKNDLFLYHPYDSFSPVSEFIAEAAADPKVKAIKQTLYRTGDDSTLVNSLIEARRAGKQVTAVVELKARFDEMRNITWAHAMEEAGINVVYGLVGMKIHAKLCLVIRQEDEGLTTYIHLGTGNYNPVTAQIYTDLGLLTADQALGRDAVKLFNVMTGLSRFDKYEHLLVSPTGARRGVIERINREIEAQASGGGGLIAWKLNQLSDPEIIKSLYRASQAGVKVMLQVRGVCCLRPGVPGLSRNITVTSLVGRFLEHSRILYFRNNDEMLIGSADMMPRNLDRRIEILAPVLDRKLKNFILNDILLVHLADNQKTYRLLSDGGYEKVKPRGPAVNSQDLMLSRPGDREEGDLRP
ncbi:MAG: polyphosphate kinase 1 [Candidatus Adiutrix sp.]|jgi:polyphosphate kinase|nr:polyphosphate kinase 1 [Candidatus Adiutrix sp.]